MILEFCREYKIIRAFVFSHEFTGLVSYVIKILAKIFHSVFLVHLRPVMPESVSVSVVHEVPNVFSLTVSSAYGASKMS